MRPLLLLLALLAVPPDALAAGDWRWPVRGEVITPYRNGGDPYAAGQHRGIDVAAPVGTPVSAATAGTIEYAGGVGSAGLTVSQRTADGDHRLSYLHLSDVAVRRGDAVAAGERLGEVGTTGTRSADAPHLHFGVRTDGDRHSYLDPLRFLAPPPIPASQPRPVPVPAPAGEPVRPTPAPVPVPVPAPAPAPVPVPVPALGPAPAASPSLAGAPAPSPVPAPRPASPAAAAERKPTGALAAQHVVARAAAASAPAGETTAPAADAQRAPATGPASDTGAGTRAEAAPARASGGSGGIDVGWLAACAGLVVAAALLAGPHGARRGHAPVRTAFGALLRAASRG